MEARLSHSVLQDIIRYSSLIIIVLETIFVFICLRYGRLLKDKSFIILINLGIISAVILSLPHLIYKYEDCIVKAREIIYPFETLLILGLLFKSFFNLINPNCDISRQKFFSLLCLIYILLLISVVLELTSQKCHLEVSIESRILSISICILFICSSIVYNITYMIKVGLNNFFHVKDIDFLLTNAYFVCAVPLMIDILVINFILKKDYNHEFHDIAFIIYTLKPIYLFTILYNYSTIFNKYFKKYFGCVKKNKDINDLVVFNNDITIINVYSSSHI